MRTCGRGAIFSGASWDATVSSPAKLRWSRNLKRDSRACRSTSKLARACCAGRSARSEVEASEPRTAHFADRSNRILCNLCRSRFSPSWHESLGKIGSWREDNIQRLELSTGFWTNSQQSENRATATPAKCFPLAIYATVSGSYGSNFRTHERLGDAVRDPGQGSPRSLLESDREHDWRGLTGRGLTVGSTGRGAGAIWSNWATARRSC